VRLLSCSTSCCGIARVNQQTSCPSSQHTCARIISAAVAALALAAFPAEAQTAAAAMQPVFVFGIPVDFILFALTLVGIARFHHRTLQVALAGLPAIVLCKLVLSRQRAELPAIHVTMRNAS